ncbi:MAG: hypothetical protein K0U74_17485 [Alphaproteobacteria bacterium]|nr:hypothetical protein [Alphaproteobacteria bacterium]
MTDEHDQSGGDSRPKAPEMPDAAIDAVGRKVKQSYEKLLKEPIPDRLIELLDQLEQSSPENNPEDKT